MLPTEERATIGRPAGVSLAPEMRPILVVVAHILSHQPLQMPLIEDDHVVEQVSSAAPYPTLSDAVLPRAAKRGSRWRLPMSLTNDTTSWPNFES